LEFGAFLDSGWKSVNSETFADPSVFPGGFGDQSGATAIGA
jgi:hypothetical protein